MRHSSFFSALVVVFASLAPVGCTATSSGTSTSGNGTSPTTKTITSSSPSSPASVVAPENGPSYTGCKMAFPGGQTVEAKAINQVVLRGYDAAANKVATLTPTQATPGVTYGVQACRGEPFWTDAFYDSFKKGEVKTKVLPGTDWASGMFLAWIKVGELPGMDEVSVGYRALVQVKEGSLVVEGLGLWQSTSGNDLHGSFHHVGDRRYFLERRSNSGEEATLEDEEQVWLLKDGAWIDTGTFLEKYEETRNFPLEKIKRSMTAQIEANGEGFVLRETWTFSPAEGKTGKSTTKKIERKATFQSEKWVFTPPLDFPKP
jgi:hypothetical protein